MMQPVLSTVSLLLLLVAGSAQAQTDGSSTSRDAVAEGESPVPQITSISTLRESIILGETFDIAVHAENKGGLADFGVISLSFPDFTKFDDTQFVSTRLGTSDGSPGYGETSKGQSIRRRDGSTATAAYLRVEFGDEQWEASEINTLVLRVQPQAVGTFTIQIRVTMQKVADFFSDPSTGPTDQQGWEVITRTVTVVAAPEILVSPPSHDYGTVTVDSSASRFFSIANTGGGTLTGNVFISGGVSYSITSGGGSFSLASGQDLSVVVRFTPTASGVQSGTLRVTHGAPNTDSPIDAFLTGSGVVQPQIGISPGSHEYGMIVVGEDSSLTFTIENTGGETLVGVISVVSGGSHYSIVSGGGNYSLPAGQSTEVEVRFAPLSVGRQTDTLQVTHNGSNQDSPINALLSGTGVRLPAITLNPIAHDYGTATVGKDSAHTFTITNSGGGQLSGEASVLSDDGSFSIGPGGGSYNLTAGQTKSVTVRYAPEAAGDHSGTLRVTHNGSNANAPIDAALTGSAVAAPIDASMLILLENDTLNFDPFETRAAFLIGNLGPDSLEGFVSLTNLGAAIRESSFTIDQGAGSFVIARDKVHMVGVLFNRGGPTGVYEAEILITHNASNLESPTRIVVLKTWVLPVATETTTDFGEFALLPSYPNPAFGQMQVTFVIDEPGHARLILYDMLGREVKRIIDERRNPGQTSIAFPISDLPGGRYVLRLQMGERSVSQIMVVR